MSTATLLQPPEEDLGARITAPGYATTAVTLDANVLSAAPFGDGAAFGLGDGQVVGFAGGAVTPLARQAAAVSALVAGQAGSIYAASQDGSVLAIGPDTREITAPDGVWVEALAVHGERVAFAKERSVSVFEGSEAIAVFRDHPSTVTGLAFSPDGRQLAACHYNGVTLYDLTGEAEVESLSWKGSLIALSWSPDGRFVVASTQDRELHIWDLVTSKDYRLGGFAGKVRSCVWTPDATHLVTTGADVIAAWPMAGEPGALPPREIGYVYNATVRSIAPRSAEMIAGGYSDGAILLGRADDATAKVLRSGDGAAVSALCWSHDGLYFGTGNGTAGIIETCP